MNASTFALLALTTRDHTNDAALLVAAFVAYLVAATTTKSRAFRAIGALVMLGLVLLALSGCAPAYAQRRSPVAGALGGAAVGAAAGVAGGAIAGDPGKGAAIGAIVGGIVGLFSGGRDDYYNRPYGYSPQCYYAEQPYPYPPVLVCPEPEPPVVIYRQPRYYYPPPPVVVIEPGWGNRGYGRPPCRRGWGW